VRLQPDEGAENQEEVPFLGSCASDPGFLSPAALLDAPVVVLNAPAPPPQGLPPLLRQVEVAGRPVLHTSFLGGRSEDPDEPVALQVHDPSLGGISTVLTATFPLPSGLTRRLPFSLASQCQPWFLTAFRFFRLAYQLSKSTHRGLKPRSLAFRSMSWKCSFPALRGVCRRL